MPSFKDQLNFELNHHGWECVSREQADLDWWADECWTIESRRKHWGLSAFIYFLVDPHWDGPRKKGQGVWAVTATNSIPADRLEAEKAFAFMRMQSGHFREQLLNFIKELSAWRDSLA